MTAPPSSPRNPFPDLAHCGKSPLAAAAVSREDPRFPGGSQALTELQPGFLAPSSP